MRENDLTQGCNVALGGVCESHFVGATMAREGKQALRQLTCMSSETVRER